MLHITIDSAIRVTGFDKDVYPELALQLRRDLVIENPEYSKLKRLGRQAWGVPPDLRFYRYDRVLNKLTLPRGYWSRFHNHLHRLGIDHEVDDRQVVHSPVAFHSRIVLRDYQVPAVETMLREEQGILEAPCGAGKTQIGLELIARLGQPALWLTHTKDLANQVIQRATECLGVPAQEIGLIGAGCRRLGDRLTIGLVQTMTDIDDLELLRSFGVVVLDECFPAGTIVDGRPIETFAVGDFITAWDQFKLVQDKVIHVFKRKPNMLVRITTNHGNVVCTPNHLFYTPRGWCYANNLQKGDLTLYAKTNNDNLYIVSKTNNPDSQKTARSFLSNWTSLLFRRTQRNLCTKNKITNHETNQFSQIGITVKTHERTESNVASRNQGQGQSNTQKHELATSISRREWSRTICATKNVGRGVKMANGSYNSNQNAQRDGLSKTLQIRYCQQGIKNSHRGRWFFSLFTRKASTRSKKGNIFEWARVDSIEILEPGSDGRFEGMCPDGFVYNLEVERCHTYIANGFIVHNCHHSPAATWTAVLDKLPARYRYGVTATLQRGDGLEVAAHLYLGPTLYEITSEAVQSAGGTVVPKLVTIKYPGRNRVWEEHIRAVEEYKAGRIRREPRLDYSALLTELLRNEERNHMILQTIVWNARNHVSLVLSERIEHCLLLRDRLKAQCPGIRATVVHGQQQREVREQILTDVREGRLDVLFAVDIAKEGLDVPRLDRLHLVAGGRNEAELKQKVGRIMRPAPGKTDAVVFDYVDENVGVLINQYYARRRVYRELGILPGRPSRASA